MVLSFLKAKLVPRSAMTSGRAALHNRAPHPVAGIHRPNRYDPGLLWYPPSEDRTMPQS